MRVFSEFHRKFSKAKELSSKPQQYSFLRTKWSFHQFVRNAERRRTAKEEINNSRINFEEIKDKMNKKDNLINNQNEK